MNSEEMEKAIERLKAMPRTSLSAYEVAVAFMGHRNWLSQNVRDELVEVLEKAKTNWWVGKSTKEDIDKVNDSKLAEWGLIRLPVDRDGETIRINDEMRTIGGLRIVVKRLKYSEKHGWMIGGANYDDLSEYGLFAPDVLTHHCEPTVKDVMREFKDKWNYVVDNGDENVTAALVIDCAEKLREVMDA